MTIIVLVLLGWVALSVLAAALWVGLATLLRHRATTAVRRTVAAHLADEAPVVPSTWRAGQVRRAA